MASVIVVELNEAIALSTNEEALVIPARNPLHLPDCLGRLLARRTPFGHLTRSYEDYVNDDPTHTAEKDYVTVGEFISQVRPNVSDEIKAARSALAGQPRFIFQSFHNFVDQVKRQNINLILRYQPSTEVDPLLQELEFIHEIHFTRGHFRDGQLYRGEEPVEMKESTEERFQVWQDEEGQRPFPRSVQAVHFSTLPLYVKGSWRDPIEYSVVTTLQPIQERLVAQDRGDLVVVDPWQALLRSDYYQECYQEALVRQRDPNSGVRYRTEQEQLQVRIQQYLHSALEILRRHHWERDGSWKLRGVPAIEQSQFYAQWRHYLGQLPVDEWAKLHFHDDKVLETPTFPWMGVPLAPASTSASAPPPLPVRRQHRFRARRGQGRVEELVAAAAAAAPMP